MGILENNIEQILQWDHSSKESKLEKQLVQVLYLIAGFPPPLSPHFLLFFLSSLGSAHYCQTNSDGEASWKRAVWRSVDGQMEG